MIKIALAIESFFVFCMAVMFLLNNVELKWIEKEYVPKRTFMLNSTLVVIFGALTVLFSA